MCLYSTLSVSLSALLDYLVRDLWGLDARRAHLLSYSWAHFCTSHCLCELCLPALILWSSQFALALFACCSCRSLSFLLLQSQTQTISLNHKTFQEPPSSFLGIVPLSPMCMCLHAACSGCTHDWAMRGIPWHAIHSQMISVPSGND